MNILDLKYLGNTVQEWFWAAGIATVISVVSTVVLKLVIRRLEAFAASTATKVDDLILVLLRNIKLPLLFLVAIYLGSLHLDFPERTELIIHRIFIIVLLFQAGIWGGVTIAFAVAGGATPSGSVRHDSVARTAFNIWIFVGKVLLWAGVILLALENLGISVTGLLAGLGIGGIAVALALQNVLSDLFASLAIMLDKPFVLGDFIVLDDSTLGTVEHIGMKTTRLLSLSGEQIICSNADLLKIKIHNYQRMQQRRVVFSIGVMYETPHDKLAAIGSMIEDIIKHQEHTRFDRANFIQYDASALKFEIVYYVLSPDYNLYIRIQEAINLAIFRRFEQEEIAFAHPIMQMVTKGRDNGKPAPPAKRATAKS